MIREGFDEHRKVVDASVDAVEAPLRRAIAATVSAFAAGRKLLVFGNGGSSTQAQHLASELVGRFEKDRRPWPAVALTVDQAALTAIGNDLGFERVFARQVEALARPGDIVVGISTSGTSRNVVEGLAEARRTGATTIALTGAGGGDLATLADILIAVPAERVARIQEVHTLCLHLWCEAIEAADGEAEA